MLCIFCQIIDRKAPASIAYEDELFVAFLDIYPVRPGHLLLVPKEHAQRLGELPPWLAGQLFACAQTLSDALRASAIPCDDLNLVLNDGPAANQSVAHLHLHLVPRTRGDLRSLGRKLVQRPIQRMLGQERRHVLAAQAEQIRKALRR